jgi:hypothetical protein
MVGLSSEFPAESHPGRDGAEPRLFITEMVMENFKSYAGEQRVGPFHKVFVAVPISWGVLFRILALLYLFYAMIEVILKIELLDCSCSSILSMSMLKSRSETW